MTNAEKDVETDNMTSNANAMTQTGANGEDFSQITAADIVNAIMGMRDNIAQVSGWVTRALAARPDLLEGVISSGVPKSWLTNMERVGCGYLLPELMTAPEHVKRLLPADQRKVLEGRVEMLVQREDGEWDAIKVDLVTCNNKAVRKQVFDGPTLRSVDEQRLWLIQQQAQSTGQDQTKWKVLAGGKVKFVSGITLTRSELMHILRTLE